MTRKLHPLAAGKAASTFASLLPWWIKWPKPSGLVASRYIIPSLAPSPPSPVVHPARPAGATAKRQTSKAAMTWNASRRNTDDYYYEHCTGARYEIRRLHTRTVRERDNV
eukprot:scaffold238764_cov46-Prasinocladus_malaysianus.AAC.1